MIPLSSSGKVLDALPGSNPRPASASVRESPLARGPIGHATDSTSQCNSCAKPATITGIRYNFCSLYPGRNIPLRKFEDACRPRSALLWQGKLCPNIKVFGVLRGEYGRFRACLNDYSDQFRSKRAEINPPTPPLCAASQCGDQVHWRE